jgi:hypothetical protein
LVAVCAAKHAVIQWLLWYKKKGMSPMTAYQIPFDFEHVWLQREAA